MHKAVVSIPVQEGRGEKRGEERKEGKGGGERKGEGKENGSQEEGRQRKWKERKREHVQEETRKLAHVAIVPGLHCSRSLSWLSVFSLTNATGFCSFS